MRKYLAVSALAAVATISMGATVQALPSAGSGIRLMAGSTLGADQIRYHRYRSHRHRCGGFPVWALGPYPSGFGDERRTGRPYYAGRRC